MPTDERLVPEEIAKAPEALGLFLLPQISDAMQAVTWDVRAEIGMLAEIAQDTNVRAAVRMDAAQRIREIVKEAAVLNGYIRSVMMTSEHQAEAGSITVSVTGDRFLGDHEETLRKLQEGMALHAKQPQLNAGRRAPRLVPEERALNSTEEPTDVETHTTHEGSGDGQEVPERPGVGVADGPGAESRLE